MKIHPSICALLRPFGWCKQVPKYLTRCTFLGGTVLTLLLLALGSCSKPREAEPYYNVTVFNLGDDNAIAVYSDPIYSDLNTRVYQKFGHTILPPGHPVEVGKYAFVEMEGRFKNGKYPDALVDIFVVENLTDKPQKCFVYQWGYHPAFQLSYKRLIKYTYPTSKDQPTTNDGFVKVPTVRELGNHITELNLMEGGRDKLPAYWEEIHRINSSIALELAPRQKLHLKWKLK